MKYWPFGGTRSTTGVISTDKLYTGQQQEPGDVLELYHYNARVYSTLMGRFLSVDPIAGSSPQRLNPYSYVANNPMRYVDPSGTCLPDIDCLGDQGTQETELAREAVESWPDSRSIERTRDGCDAACQIRLAAEAFAAAAHAELVASLQYLAKKEADETAAALAWSASQTIANRGAGECDTACRAAAASRSVPVGESDSDDNGCGRNLFCAANNAYDQAKDAATGCGGGSLDACLTAAQLADLIPIDEVCRHRYCIAVDGFLDLLGAGAAEVQIFRECQGNASHIAGATAYNVANFYADDALPKRWSTGGEVLLLQAARRHRQCVLITGSRELLKVPQRRFFLRNFHWRLARNHWKLDKAR